MWLASLYSWDPASFHQQKKLLPKRDTEFHKALNQTVIKPSPPQEAVSLPSKRQHKLFQTAPRAETIPVAALAFNPWQNFPLPP